MDNNELVKRYKEIYKKNTGKDLSDAETLDQVHKLVTLVKVVYQPISKKVSDDKTI